MSGGDVWEVGDAYEAYVGRWSRLVAAEFMRWLGMPDGLRWLDVGRGTGALTAAVPDGWTVGLDRSLGFIGNVQNGVNADGTRLPFTKASFDVVVSGLALNFMPDPEAAVTECARVAKRGGTVAAYVWDYGDGMQMMRHFWDVVDAGDADESRRFPICRPEALRAAWTGAGLREVETGAIEVPTVFADFDDYWTPFLGGQGAAPAYLARMSQPARDLVEHRLRERLGDGPIALTATAWTVRGKK